MVAHVVYQCGVVLPVLEAQRLGDGAHLFEHPDDADGVVRARTHLFEPVRDARPAHA